MDPLADKFINLSPYNYASNNPVTNIDFWGLQGIDNNKARKEILKGTGNIIFGSVATAASAIYIGGSSGVGAAFGGGAALTLSIGEVSLGFAQVADGINSLKSGKKPEQALSNSNTLPGLTANVAGSENAELIDAVSGVIPGMLTGGNIKTILKAPELIKGSKTVGETTFHVLDAVDAASDVFNLGKTVVGTENNTTNTNTSSSNSHTVAPVKLPEVTPIDKAKLVVPKIISRYEE